MLDIIIIIILKGWEHFAAFRELCYIMGCISLASIAKHFKLYMSVKTNEVSKQLNR